MQDSEAIFNHLQYSEAINQLKILNTKETESQNTLSAIFQALPGWLNDRGQQNRIYQAKIIALQKSKLIDLFK